MEHEFTPHILKILRGMFGNKANNVFESSPLLQYLNIKTRSATRGSKARSSFANIYAVYVLVEDYLNNKFDIRGCYDEYEGARFKSLFKRQRELPFGNKLQNHALNHRLNEEFKKYFPEIEYIPILRDVQTNRYWINENLLKIIDGRSTLNIASAIVAIIDCYVEIKRSTFKIFIDTCERLKSVTEEDDYTVSQFIESLLASNVDARTFEIVSYAILRYYYHDQVIYFGYELTHIQEENLKLYKTGRTNANDGGIDFVMRPVGRFFQVTETLDIRKYFLDIDKIERFPISFVIKSEEEIDALRQKLRDGAKKQYAINAIVDKYMNCIEEIINIPILIERFYDAQKKGYLRLILDEIIKQSKIEFNYDNLSEA